MNRLLHTRCLMKCRTAMSITLCVTVTQVLYPISEAVLHQVFEVYGYHVVEMCVFQGATRVEAIVQLQSQHEATQARDALNGRAIYDGCCFLDIDYVSPACTTAAAPEVDNKASLTPSSKLEVVPKADLTKAACHDVIEGTSVVNSSAATTSALPVDKEEKTVMEMLAEIKATLDGMLVKADVSPPPPTPTAAWSTTNPAAPSTGSDSLPNSHSKCSTFGLGTDSSAIPVIEVPLTVEGVPQIIHLLVDAAASHEIVPLKVPTMVNTNSDGLGEELRPLPWPSFVCEVGPVHLKESCTQPEGILEKEADAMHAKQDIAVVPTSMAPISQVCAALPITDMGEELQVGNVMPFDPGRKLPSRLPILLAIPHAREEVRVLPGGLENHDLRNLDNMCNIFPTANNQWSSKINSCGILTNGQQSNMLLVYALERRLTWEISVTCFNKVLNMKPKPPWLFNAQSARHVANILGIPMPVLTEYSALPMLLSGSAHEEGLNPPWDPGKGTKYYVQFVQHTFVKGNPKMQGTIQHCSGLRTISVLCSSSCCYTSIHALLSQRSTSLEQFSFSDYLNLLESCCQITIPGLPLHRNDGFMGHNIHELVLQMKWDSCGACMQVWVANGAWIIFAEVPELNAVGISDAWLRCRSSQELKNSLHNTKNCSQGVGMSSGPYVTAVVKLEQGKRANCNRCIHMCGDTILGLIRNFEVVLDCTSLWPTEVKMDNLVLFAIKEQSLRIIFSWHECTSLLVVYDQNYQVESATDLECQGIFVMSQPTLHSDPRILQLEMGQQLGCTNVLQRWFAIEVVAEDPYYEYKCSEANILRHWAYMIACSTAHPCDLTSWAYIAENECRGNDGLLFSMIVFLAMWCLGYVQIFCTNRRRYDEHRKTFGATGKLISALKFSGVQSGSFAREITKWFINGIRAKLWGALSIEPDVTVLPSSAHQMRQRAFIPAEQLQKPIGFCGHFLVDHLYLLATNGKEGHTSGKSQDGTVHVDFSVHDGQIRMDGKDETPWDPGGSFCRPAWGQAGFQGGGNVTDRAYMRIWWIGTWARLSKGDDLLLEKPKSLLQEETSHTHQGREQNRSG